MTLEDPTEIHLIEKYREALEKARATRPRGSEVTRGWSSPDQTDSDDQIYCSVAVRIVSGLPSMDVYQVALEKSRER